MGKGSVNCFNFISGATLATAALAIILTACPAREPEPQKTNLSAQYLAAAVEDPDWPEEGTVKAYA